MNNLFHGICTFSMIVFSVGYAMDSITPRPQPTTNQASALQEQQRIEGQPAQRITVRQLLLAGFKEPRPLSQAQLLVYAATLDTTEEFRRLEAEEIPERLRMHGEPINELVESSKKVLAKEKADLEQKLAQEPRSWAPYTLTAAASCCLLNYLKVRFCGTSGDEPCEKIALFLGGLGIAELKESFKECVHTKETRIKLANSSTLVELLNLKTFDLLKAKANDLVATKNKKLVTVKIAEIIKLYIQEIKGQRASETLTTAQLQILLSPKMIELQTKYAEHITTQEAQSLLIKALNDEMSDSELDALLEKLDQELEDTKDFRLNEETETANNTPLPLQEKKNQ